jgi:preprotein translocase subunit SecA
MVSCLVQVLPIPTALPVARRDNEDAVFKNQDGKMKALVAGRDLYEGR